MSFWHKWKDRVLARKVPAFIVHDVENVEFRDDLVRESNHLTDSWNDKSYEIQTKPLKFIVGGKPTTGYICSDYGVTANLVEDVTCHPTGRPEVILNVRWSGIIGKLTSIDVIEKGLDLVGSMKRALMFLGVGILLGWLVFAPIVNKILS